MKGGINVLELNMYGEVENSKKNYKDIADILSKNRTIGIGWTDGKDSHFDILFKYGLDYKIGTFQRGIRSDYLFISIIGWTSYGFRTDSLKDSSYIIEKLGINGEAGEKITELINGIIEELSYYENHCLQFRW